MKKLLLLAIGMMIFITAYSQESLETTLDEFVKDMSGASLSPEMSKYISEALYSSYSDEQIKELSIKYPYSKALKELNNGDKRLGKVLTLVSAISGKAKKQKVLQVKSIGDVNDPEVLVMFTLGQYVKTSTWKKNETEQWQLTSTDILNDVRLDVYDGITTFEKYIDRSYEWGMMLPMTKVATMGVAFNWYYYRTTSFYGGAIELGKFTFKDKEGEKETYGCVNFIATAGWQKQYMLKNKALLYPYLKLNFGMNFPNGLIWGGCPGAKYGWRSQKGNLFFVYTQCDLRYFKEFSKSDEGIGNHMTAGLQIGIGVGLR